MKHFNLITVSIISPVLQELLADKTTGKNIIFATDEYADLGVGYKKENEITLSALKNNAFCLQPRALKNKLNQLERTKKRAEVFTPLSTCRFMNDFYDKSVIIKEAAQTNAKNTNWLPYIHSTVLEITCGEAPFIVTRYDAVKGNKIELQNRIGILDRKLFIVTKNSTSKQEWLTNAFASLKSVYGYEFAGDSLLLARINVLVTFAEHFKKAFNTELASDELSKAAKIIAWNFWQMDGITKTIPFGTAQKEDEALFLFAEMQEPLDNKTLLCKIKDWQKNKIINFSKIKGNKTMKFDFVIGNPPYQDLTLGDNDTFAPPIYNVFMDSAFEVARKAELIHPARFLFNAGSTPKAWNEKMLKDEHLKVLYYEQNSSKVFANTDIKGGVAITYHDTEKTFGAIGVFTSFPELNSILIKAEPKTEAESLISIIFIQNRFNLDILFSDHPEYKKVIGSDGKDKRFRNNIFEKISAFAEKKMNENDIKVLGIKKNKRVYRYLPRNYFDFNHENINKYKVLVPQSNGSGAIGEVLSTPLIGAPLIGAPLIGYTQSFMSIGSFDIKKDAEAAFKYIKSRFARAMLGVLKITQHNPRDTWKYVPLQDFTDMSDIDWSVSVAEIDEQLFAKYKLDKTEIAFIKTHVKEMV